MIGTQTEGSQFIAFLNEILHSRVDRYSASKIVLIMDKHSAHSGEPKGVRQFIQQYFRPYFLPSSTCWLNSCETFFAVMKEKVKKRFLFEEDDIDDPAVFVRIIEEKLQ